MNKNVIRWIAGLQVSAVLLTGCHPTQPFYLNDRGDLAHFLDKATEIEYPDLNIESLPEATQSYEPLSVDNHDYEFMDITLEECIAYALANTKLVRAVPGSTQNTGNIATSILSSPSSQLNTTFDPAITSSTASTQPQVIDGNGNRTLPRGAARANQTGGVEDALSEFDAQYSSFVSYNQTDRARNVGPLNPFNPQQFQADDVTYQNAISKRLATGGVTTARTQTLYSFNNIPAPGTGRQFPEDYTQIVEVQLQHPLMRGRGAMVNRIPVVLARINEDISLNQYEERIRNLIKEVENSYWDLYFAYWNVETSKVARDSALDAWRVTKANLDLGQGKTYSEAQAQAQVHQFQAQTELALTGGNLPGADPGVFGRERELRYLMGWASSDGRLLRPSDKPTTARVEFDWYAALGEALTRNIDLRQQQWIIKQRELELVSAKNQVLPELNVSALYRWLGVGNSLSRRSGGNAAFPSGPASAFEELLGGNYQEASLRMEYIPPAFGARRQLSIVRNSQLQLAREIEVLREKEMALNFELAENLNLMKSHHEQTQIKLNQWAASERDAKSWQDVFEVGTTDLKQEQIVDNLLRAQERRARAQQEYFRALSEYNKSIVQIHLLKGSLLEYNNIALEEGPWAEKAYWDAQEHARERAAGTPLPYGASRPGVISEGPYQQMIGTNAMSDRQPITSLTELGPNAGRLENRSPAAVEPEKIQSSPSIDPSDLEEMPEPQTGTVPQTMNERQRRLSPAGNQSRSNSARQPIQNAEANYFVR